MSSQPLYVLCPRCQFYTSQPIHLIFCYYLPLSVEFGVHYIMLEPISCTLVRRNFLPGCKAWPVFCNIKDTHYGIIFVTVYNSKTSKYSNWILKERIFMFPDIVIFTLYICSFVYIFEVCSFFFSC